MCDAVAAMGRQIKELSPKEAAARGSLSMLMHLQRRGRLNERDRLCPNAAAFGQLETLQWLRANGCPWDATTWNNAVIGGHLELLKWAHANGCPWDKDTCVYAAGVRKLEVLQWLRADDCPLDENTPIEAAQNDHPDVFLWARMNGCPGHA